jgi:hypothetical protein
MAAKAAGAERPIADRRVTNPRAGALAGVAFAVLFSIATVIMRVTMDDASTDTGEWLANGAGWFAFAISLMPFAGIFFLWFIGVARLHLGHFEDQFFSTVFIGSGLLFLAMVFVASGVAGSIVAGYSRDPEGFGGSVTYFLARDVLTQVFGIYAMRMAAVFIFSQAGLWLRTKVMPRWMAFVSVLVGLLLLFVYTSSTWVLLVFPGWVFLVSCYILVRSFRSPRPAGATGLAAEAGATSIAPGANHLE